MATGLKTTMPENTPYSIANIRFEIEPKGYATIWFDLGGPAFAEPEAMANMFVELGAFLQFLAHQQPALYAALLPEGAFTHGDWLERLETANFDWDISLRAYIDRHLNLQAAEQERVGWLHARRARAANAAQQQLEADWSRLSAQAEPNAQPTWDDVVHALIDNLNATAVELFPELLEYGADDTSRLRDMIESHGERLANQLVALTRSVQKDREHNAGKRDTR